MGDYKKLINQFKNAEVLNKLLDVLIESYNNFDDDIKETFEMLDIENCSGEWLDNLGALIGVTRPMLDTQSYFLKADDLYDSLDVGNYYVTNAPTTSQAFLATDDYYRSLIRSQIWRNNTTEYSVNALERMFQLIFPNEAINDIYCEFSNSDDFKTGKMKVHVPLNVSHMFLAFIQRKSKDNYGRLKFDFPYPPTITQIVVVQDL